MSTSAGPTIARVDTLAHWSNLFHPTKGAFRSPSTDGATIEHLDIDLRFVHSNYNDDDDEEPVANKDIPLSASAVSSTAQPGTIHLPKVCVLTLRGAEHCQDSDDAMEALLEVLLSLNPVEVRW